MCSALRPIADAFVAARAARPSLKALLFDLDGTLIDTMSLHFEAYRQTFLEMGGKFEREDFDRLSGPPAHSTIPEFAIASGLDRPGQQEVLAIHSSKKRRLSDLLEGTSLPHLAAAEILIQNSSDYHTALVTSGNAHGAKLLLHAAGLGDEFDVMVTGDDVKSGKPAPAPYLLALERLSIGPAEALAFEDLDKGIKSATAAGLAVIDVRSGIIHMPDAQL